MVIPSLPRGRFFPSSPSSKCCIPTSPLPSQLMTLLLVSQMQSIEDVFTFQFLHLPNSGCCLLWPLFSVDGQPMLLSQSGSPSWVPDLHFSLLFREKLTLVTESPLVLYHQHSLFTHLPDTSHQHTNML